MSHRLSLRALVVATAVAGAVIVPSTAAFADTTPTPRATEPAPEPTRGSGIVTAPPQERMPSAVPRGGVAAGDKPAPARGGKRAAAPRGGVNAGERPAGSASGNTTALAGSAAALALVVGAGTFVVRRRSASHRNG
ncbi:hypothetical protein ABT010_08385 [Streptomyces sp. NPDC002668]|uniref:hypothetical protein n=1 Tax=Streptomyces sp. NPDC002668 TaxID=3154422 RepID=UPI003319D1EF